MQGSVFSPYRQSARVNVADKLGDQKEMQSCVSCLMDIWKTVFYYFQSLFFLYLQCIRVYCHESVHALEQCCWLGQWSCPEDCCGESCPTLSGHTACSSTLKILKGFSRCSPMQRLLSSYCFSS